MLHGMADIQYKKSAVLSAVFLYAPSLSVITIEVEESHKNFSHFLLEKKESDKEILFNESGEPLYSDICLTEENSTRWRLTFCLFGVFIVQHAKDHTELFILRRDAVHRNLF